MGNLLEFLFCPVHGLFRPDNLTVLYVIFQNGLANFHYLWRKLLSL